MHLSGFRRCLIAAALAVLPFSASMAQADKPITLLVGATPGGTTDRVARGIAKEMSGLLKQTVIVENKAGAGGNIAADMVARSNKDGDTLLISFTSFSVNASLYKKLPFDPKKDFTPITLLAEVPSVLLARKDFPANSVAELIALAKKNPGDYSFAVGGIGSSLHMATASFQMDTGIKGLTVPYKGTSPALQDLVGGQVDLMFASVENALPLLNTGRVKFLGVTSTESMKQFPGVPPISNTVPGFKSKAWFGMFGPAGMSPEKVALLNKAAVEGAKHATFIDLMTHGGGEVVTTTPQEFSDYVAKDIDHYAKVVEFTGATVN
ncbi:MAG: tripartite tricarboxylate transporter substrate binding protein [Burkholderiaceae bacterium]